MSGESTVEDGDSPLAVVKPKRSVEQMQQLVFEGMMPYFNPSLYEMTNAIVRSGLFAIDKRNSDEMDSKVVVPSAGNARITRTGFRLNQDHEAIWVCLLSHSRGRSITKDIRLPCSDLIKVLGIARGGTSYKRARQIVSQLQNTTITIQSASAAKHLYRMLTDVNITKRPDGLFLHDYIKNRHAGLLAMLKSSISRGEDAEMEIPLKFIETAHYNQASREFAITLDPLTCLFFDGVHTTLLPIEEWRKHDSIARKILAFAASHRQGVFRMGLRNYFNLCGSRADYDKQHAKFKFLFLAACKGLEEDGLIHPGWAVIKNRDHEWMVEGIVVTDKLSIANYMEPDTRSIFSVPSDLASGNFEFSPQVPVFSGVTYEHESE